MLLPDFYDEDIEVLPSFPSIRRKTLGTLYSPSNDDDGAWDDITGRREPATQQPNSNLELKSAGSYMDKSPKASVDTRIRPLVDLINRHPSYATLSSCSGRIAIFDPNAARRHSRHHRQRKEASGLNNAVSDTACDESIVSSIEAADEPPQGSIFDGGYDNVIVGDNRTTADGNINDSGKGGTGAWLMVSHEPISDTAPFLNLFSSSCIEKGGKDAFDADDAGRQRPILLKFEPMLLHVAASSLRRGKKLLQLALRLGFRESGLVVTDTRVTVAVRSYGLSLTVPLFWSNDDYLEALLNESNRRLLVNIMRIGEFYNEIERSLFRSAPVRMRVRDPSNQLPNLNLWGQGTVLLPAIRTDTNSDVKEVDHVLVFGGYGPGPSTDLMDKPLGTSRSDKIWRLVRGTNRNWSDHWDEIIPCPKCDLLAHFGINLRRLRSIGLRQGSAACLLPSCDAISNVENSNNFIAVFGGRRGPGSALGDLLLCEYFPLRPAASGIVVNQVTSTRGEAPSPRWGHTLTGLTGRDGKLVALAGGRNHDYVFDTVHVLSRIEMETDNEMDGSEFYLLWETIVFDGSSRSLMQRFSHTAVRLCDDEILILGGLSKAGDALECFSTSIGNTCTNKTESSSVALFDAAHPAKKLFVSCSSTNTSAEKAFEGVSRFGHSACLLRTNLRESTTGSARCTLLICGGIATETNSLFQVLELRRTKQGWDLVVSSRDDNFILQNDGKVLDFGALVDHDCCCILPRRGMSDEDGWETLLVGGGVPGFSFGPIFAKSYAMELVQYDESRPITCGRLLLSHSAPRSRNSGQQTNAKDMHETRQTEGIDVVYVLKKDAKTLKGMLECRNFLVKSRRMAPATTDGGLEDPTPYIAVPVTSDCLDQLSGSDEVLADNGTASWKCLVQGRGRQRLPFSTAVHAKNSLKR